MLVKNCIYFISIALSLFSVVQLMYSIKNKNKYLCKWIIILDIIYLIYLFSINYIISFLYIPVGLEILIVYLFKFVAEILFIASIIINSIKRKKLDVNKKSKKIILFFIMLVLVPTVFVATNICETKRLINNSKLILVYESNGNGGIGDSEEFAYAIGNDFCRQFDLGIDIGGYELKKFLPKNVVEINSLDELYNYKIKFNDYSISVYKNNKKICKVKNKTHYFNIDFEKGFYIN